MKKDFRVAVIQAEIPKNIEESERKIERLVKKAVSQPVDMIGLPEGFLGEPEDVKNGYDAVSFYSKIAAKYKIYLFGAAIIKENGKLYNLGFLLDRSGKLVGKHKKIALTPPEENNGIKPGKTLEVFDTEFGRMSILVCKDSFHRYASIFYDKIRKAEVDIVLVPSYSLNVTQRSTELWTDSLKALAKWFDVYILASGTIGKNPTEYKSFGHALIICPKRVVLAEGSENREEVIRAKIDLKSLNDIRNTAGSKWQPKNPPKVKTIVYKHK